MEEQRTHTFTFSAKEVIKALQAAHPGNLRLRTLSDKPDFTGHAYGVTVKDTRPVKPDVQIAELNGE